MYFYGDLSHDDKLGISQRVHARIKALYEAHFAMKIEDPSEFIGMTVLLDGGNLILMPKSSAILSGDKLAVSRYRFQHYRSNATISRKKTTLIWQMYQFIDRCNDEDQLKICLAGLLV